MKRILYIQYTNPSAYPPLEHSSGIMAERGWNVRFLGTKSSGSSNALKFASENCIDERLMDYCSPGWSQKLHFMRFWIWCLANSITFRPHIIYASDGWSYPIGWSLSFVAGIEVAMHEHDTPNLTKGPVNRLIGWFRQKLARRALICICPQSDRASKMEIELKPSKMQVVYNCPRSKELLPNSKKSEDKLRLWFHGSLVPSQLPLQVIDAIARCPFPTQLQFCGYETIGHAGYVQELLNRAKELRVDNQVEYLGSIPTRKEMFVAASQCHVGLTLFAKQFREPMVGASNKPFDYLACGLTLLVPDTYEWRTFFVDAGCAIACDSEQVDSIAESLRWCWENRDELESLNNCGRELLRDHWNYEKQFQPVLEILENAASH